MASRISLPDSLRDVPRLFLGDRGFLERYGSKLTEVEIANCMMKALSLYQMGLTVGDEKTARCVYEISNRLQIFAMHHTRCLVKPIHGNLESGRAAKTLHQFVRAQLTREFLDNDEIVGFFLNHSPMSAPFSTHELSGLNLDEEMLNSEIEIAGMLNSRYARVSSEVVSPLSLMGFTAIAS